MMTKIVLSIISATLFGGIAGSAITMTVMTPDPIAAIRVDQAPVRSQAQRDIDAMKRELQQHQPSGSSANWR